MQTPKPSAQHAPVFIPRRKAPAFMAKKRVERAAAGSRRLLLIMARKRKARLREEDAQRGAFGRFRCGTPRPKNVSTGGAKPAILVHVAHLVPSSTILRADSCTELTTPMYTGAGTLYLCLRRPYTPVSIMCTYTSIGVRRNCNLIQHKFQVIYPHKRGRKSEKARTNKNYRAIPANEMVYISWCSPVS